MNAQVPAWTQLLSAFAIPIIALIAAAIGALNWRTAEKKRIQDLFDVRFAFYKRLLHELEIWQDPLSWATELVSRGPSKGNIDEWYFEALFLFDNAVALHVQSTLEKLLAGNVPASTDVARPFVPFLSLR